MINIEQSLVVSTPCSPGSCRSEKYFGPYLFIDCDDRSQEYGAGKYGAGGGGRGGLVRAADLHHPLHGAASRCQSGKSQLTADSQPHSSC